VADSGDREPQGAESDVLERLPKWIIILFELQRRARQISLEEQKQEQGPTSLDSEPTPGKIQD